MLEVTYGGAIRCASGHRDALMWTEIHDAPQEHGKELNMIVHKETEDRPSIRNISCMRSRQKTRRKS